MNSMSRKIKIRSSVLAFCLKIIQFILHNLTCSIILFYFQYLSSLAFLLVYKTNQVSNTLKKAQQTHSVKGQRVNILGFIAHSSFLK